MAYNISNYVATLLNLHSFLKKPMTKSGVLAVCRMAELLKSIQYTFHRRAILVAEFQSLAMNLYEIQILRALENMTVSTCSLYNVIMYYMYDCMTV